jgi:hypothetical protein
MEKLSSTFCESLHTRMKQDDDCSPVAHDVNARMEELRRNGAAPDAPAFFKTYVAAWRKLDGELRAAELAEADAGGAERLAALNAQSAA